MIKDVNRKSRIFKWFGPGVITGAADDDPSGITTYSQAGAQFGYGLLWTAIFMLPMMIAIQEACMRIGAIKRQGLASVIKKYYGNKILYFIVILLFIANTINIGADTGAMSAAAGLILPKINFHVFSSIFCFLILFLEIYVHYEKYLSILKYFCLSLIAYPLTVLIIDLPIVQVLQATFIPRIEFNFEFFYMITAVFGTTISPYLFFWQASEVVEEETSHQRKHALVRKPKLYSTDLYRLRTIGQLSIC